MQPRESILLVLALIALTALPLAGQSLRVTLSLPMEEMLVRAEVPVFGTAYVVGDEDGLEYWRLDYGTGRNPDEWIPIRESTIPINEDLYARGEAEFDPNFGIRGPMGMWEVGLTGYTYSSWRDDLSGIHTLRLKGKAKTGETAFRTATVIIGEAIVNTLGGTARSADGRVHLSIQPFSFGVAPARVVAVVKQAPPASLNLPFSVGPTDELPPRTNDIYATIPADLQPLSAIYRVYPNGLVGDPGFMLRIEEEPVDWADGRIDAFNSADALIYQWNPISEQWDPLPTRWIERTATTTVNRVAEYESYFAIFYRKNPIPAPRVKWQPSSPRGGTWAGLTEARAEVTVSLGGTVLASGAANNFGVFTLPSFIRPGVNRYQVRSTPESGAKHASITTVEVDGGPDTQPLAPVLRLSGTEISAGQSVFVLCTDDALADPLVTRHRSIIATLTPDGRHQEWSFLELVEVVPGSGRFAGKIDPSAPAPGGKAGPLTALPHQTRLTLSLGGTTETLTVNDSTPPVVTLTSTTHPSLLYLPAESNPSALQSATLHSQADVRYLAGEGAWEIGPIEGKPTARITYWPIEGVNFDSWPLVGFTYRTFNSRAWQIHLRGTPRGAPRQTRRRPSGLFALNLGEVTSYLNEFAPSPHLQNSGQWETWLMDLSNGPLQTVNSINFGSWEEEDGIFMVRPGFTRRQREILQIRDLWIGRSYTTRAVEMQWKIDDPSPLRRLEWWVSAKPGVEGKTEAILEGGEARNVAATGSTRFQLPEAGIWYFSLQVTDSAGNTSTVQSYPISLRAAGITDPLGTMAQLQARREPLLWQQPDGTLSVPVADMLHTVNLDSLELIIHDQAYPAPRATIDQRARTINLRHDSFSDAAPLGFNGETAPARLRWAARDGVQTIETPPMDIVFESPFNLTETGDSLHIGVEGASSEAFWNAHWSDDHGPYHGIFPNTVNNTLILFRNLTPDEIFKSERPKLWQRKIRHSRMEEPSHIWLEELHSPDVVDGTLRDADQLPTFPYHGGIAQTGREQRINRAAENWAYTLDPMAPFQRGYARLVIKERNKPLSMYRIPIRNADLLIQELTPRSTARLDFWVAPNTRRVGVRIDGHCSAELYTTDRPQPTELSSGWHYLGSDEEWIRCTVILRTPTSTGRKPRLHITGPVFW